MAAVHGQGQGWELAQVVRCLGHVGTHVRPATADPQARAGELVGSVPALKAQTVDGDQRRRFGLPLVGRQLGPFGHDQRLVFDLVEAGGQQVRTGLVQMAAVLHLAGFDAVAAPPPEVVVPGDAVHGVVAPEVGRIGGGAAGARRWIRSRPGTPVRATARAAAGSRPAVFRPGNG